MWVGHLPKTPGTFGSLAAVLPGWLVLHTFGGFGLLAAAVLAFSLGLVTLPAYLRGISPPNHQNDSSTNSKRPHKDHDPQEVVLDEVVGMWIAMVPLGMFAPGSLVLASEATRLPDDSLAFFVGLIVAFVLFRLFDIVKPGLVSSAERLPGAWGIMADDVVAGCGAYAFVWLGLWLDIYSLGAP